MLVKCKKCTFDMDTENLDRPEVFRSAGVCSENCYKALFVPREGERRRGLRFNVGKPRVDLIPWDVMIEQGKLLDIGAQKYGDRNWEQGMKYSDMYASMMRHLIAWWHGEQTDPEGGFHHLDAVIFGANGLRHYELHRDRYCENDDRPIQQWLELQEEPDLIRDCNERRWNIPELHRRLGPEEVIKENDKTWSDTMDGWITVPRTPEFTGIVGDRYLPIIRLI